MSNDKDKPIIEEMGGTADRDTLRLVEQRHDC